MPSVGHAKRKQAWFRRYGLTEVDYLKMLEAQGNACNICAVKVKEGEFLHVDHDHGDGRVRSLLCKNCNTALGNIRDDPARAARLAEYLAAHQPSPEILPLTEPAVQRFSERPDEQRGAAYKTDKELRDARLPRPEVLVAMEQAGMDKKQIAEELGISLRTTKALLSDAQRGAGLSYARDWLLRDVIPTALAKVKMGVETDSKGDFSLDLLNKLGVFPKEAVQAAPVGEGDFEELRMSLIRRHSAKKQAPETAIEAEIINESNTKVDSALHTTPARLLNGRGEGEERGGGGDGV
jgi:hypothetical protein